LLTDTKSLNRTILTLAWPAVLQNLVRSSLPIFDSFWIGKLGPEYLAAMTVASFLSWGIFAMGEMIAIGTNSLVSQSKGANQENTARHVGSTNLIVALLYGILIALTVMPLLPLLYKLTNIDAETSILSNQYLFPLLLGFPALLLFETGNSIYRGHGDTQTPFRLLVVATVIKIILTPIMIFGISGHFQYGMAGASLSTVIAYGVSFIISIIVLNRRKLILSLKNKVINLFKDFKFNLKTVSETIKIGLPLSLEGLFFSMIYVFVSRFVSDFGTVGLAALGIGHRSEAIPYMIADGFSVTATILVGHSIGAANPDYAEKIAWRIFYFGCIPMFFYGALLFFGASSVAGIFTTDADVINVAKVYNMIAAFSIFFSASEAVFTGSFAGAGNSVPPLVISLGITTLRVPLCAVFAPIYGMNGIWIAIFSTTIIKGTILALWFRRGKWKERKFALSKQNPLEYVELR
jgi:putative MATE family efflux protein